MIAVGIDIGGTFIRVGVVRIEHARGMVLATRGCATVSLDTGSTLTNWLVSAIGEVIKETAGAHSHLPEAKEKLNPQVAGIGLALPGILDHDRREVVRSVNVPLVQGLPIRDELAERTGYPVFLSTDADAATWAEYVTLPQLARSFVHLRIGTGIGCGRVVGGELQRLDLNRTGHLEVLRIDESPDATPCPCGAHGCLEAVASGRVLQQHSLQAGYVGGLADVRRGWDRGEEAAQSIVDETARALALASANLIEQFNASVISLGGGVIDSLPCLVEDAKRHLEAAREHHARRPSATVVRAALGDRAGIVGAALLAVKHR